MPEVSFTAVDEHCPDFRWPVAYLQEGTKIHVRIAFTKAAGVTDNDIATAKAVWKGGIEAKWNNKFACCSDPSATTSSGCAGAQPLQFLVEWVAENANPHQIVTINKGRGRANVTSWWTVSTTANVAAHEFGHMLANPDEYNEPGVCNRVDTGTVMDDNTGPAVSNHVSRLCKTLGHRVVPIA